jgi:3-hydroxyisobutyrate dehydrogenase-like beta-hydroxyacid dehydrogenase
MSLVTGVIGVGAMGLGVARSLLRAGFTTIARDIRPDAQAAAVALGARAADSPAALARESRVVVVLVVDAPQVEAVLFAADGAACALARGAIVMLSSTIDPAFVESVGARLATHGVALVDAPVSGGPARAHDGTLTLMAGGARAALDRCAPVMRAMASRVFEIGAVGDGARMKLCNNLLAAAHLAAAAEALALATRAGLDAKIAADVIGSSSGASWIVADRLPRAFAGDLAPPRAAARILAKDVTLAAAFARRCGVAVPLTDEAQRAFEAVVAAGHGEDDDAVLLALALRGQAGG